MSPRTTALVNVELLQLALEVVGCETLERPELGLEVMGGTSRVGREWGWVQDKVEGHPHSLSRGMGGTLQHLERNNCSNREFPYTTPSGCQLNHMLPTWNSPIGAERGSKQ